MTRGQANNISPSRAELMCGWGGQGPGYWRLRAGGAIRETKNGRTTNGARQTTDMGSLSGQGRWERCGSGTSQNQRTFDVTRVSLECALVGDGRSVDGETDGIGCALGPEPS